MSTITTRSGKGSPLSHSEGDANFTNLNTDKLENISEDSSPQLGANLDVNGNQIVSTSNANVKIYPHGTGVLEVGGDGSSADGTIQLNCSQNSHGVKIKSPPHSAGASYTLTLPTTDGNADEFLKTDGSGGLSWGTASGGSSTLSDLTDTSIASPSNGQVLAYNSGSSNWTNQGIDISSKSINDLSDVSASGPSDGQVLTYSNANSRFEPQTPSAGGGGISRAVLQSGANPSMIASTTSSWTQQAWAWEELDDPDSIVTTSGNTFTLTSGEYLVDINLGCLFGYAPSSGNAYWPTVALRNSSDSTYPWGWGDYGNYLSSTQSNFYAIGPTVTFKAYFTIASSKTFDLVYKQNTSSTGFYVYFKGSNSDWDNNTSTRSPGWIVIQKLS